MQTLIPDYRLANAEKLKATNGGKAIPSLGLAIPFQPCMQDERTIQTQLCQAADAAEMKMKDSYDEVCTNNVLVRLEKLFSKLNYNSQRKSVSLILTPDEEKVIYLNFAVKPAIYVSEHVSLLDLTAHADRQPEFYFLFFTENNAALYEHYHGKLHRVYIKTQGLDSDGKTDPAGLFKQVSQTIQLLNSKDEKPVFVTGSPTVVELFRNSPYYSNIFFTLLYESAQFCEKIKISLSKEISNHWDYWHSKFIMGRILIAQKANCLISNVEVVLKALSHSADGWLLFDKSFSRQLYKSRRVNALFNRSDELLNQVELFLTRGNSIEITETGMLKNFGGIVLLLNNPFHFTQKESIHKPDG
ncbi:MAG: hypothetical protein ABI760_22550 [Ferruginibacter sp.]